MNRFTDFLKKAWANVAVRNLANLLASVIISTQLVHHGVDAQDAATIGRASGAVIMGQ